MSMGILVVLGVSILLQLAAVALALRLITVTRRRRAWLLIAIAVSLMAGRRLITTFHLLSGEVAHPPDWAAELVALAISALMVIGIAWIEPLFRVMKQSEEALRKANRAYRTLSECNQAVVRATEEMELLREICRIIVEVGGYRLAWVGFAEQDEKKSVRPVAQAGYEEGYLDTVNITWADTARGRGPTGTAIRTGRPGANRDVLTNPNYAPWRAEAIRHGYASSLAIPLLADGVAFGALNVYAAEPDAFDTEEAALLIELADDLAYGIIALRTRAERARIEEALRKSEERYRTLVEQASDGIFIADAEGNYVDVNTSGCAMLGYSRQEILRMHINDLIPGEELAAASLRMDELQAGKTVLSERHLRRKDGSLLPVEISEKILSDGRLLSITRDITERVRLEEQLRQSQKMEAIGRLAGGIAHDFNNLLTAIGGYTQLMLQDTLPDDPRYHDLTQIRKNADRGSALIRQLLALGRQEATRLVALNLNGVVTDLIELLSRVIGEDVELVTHLSPDLAHVRADPGQMEQVLMNLAVNARDAMPEGGRLIIETANVTLDEGYANAHIKMEPGEYVLLIVSDTGIGMDEEVLSHIFEPFFTTKPEEKGTGLGLAMVYGIVRQHGGHVHVYSEPGRGTTFRIYIPAHRPQPGEQPAERRERPSRPTASLTGDETLLVVEDETSVRELVQRALEGYGYTILVAANVRQAEDLFCTHRDDVALLISDVVMPDATGPALYQSLTADVPDLKVLFLSGYTGDVVRGRGVLQDAPFLQKPFTLVDLARKVRQVLDS